ncbi:hypothetical protein [Borborobacter arsenicus]|uniref:hypothetical protein n=1 Tax=Borborobacter arsenicus TaxID=1851146 RepID=UPI00140436F5|nr:hypothetical protein [Pseudaminobacter arsenicus]
MLFRLVDPTKQVDESRRNLRVGLEGRQGSDEAFQLLQFGLTPDFICKCPRDYLISAAHDPENLLSVSKLVSNPNGSAKCRLRQLLPANRVKI